MRSLRFLILVTTMALASAVRAADPPGSDAATQQRIEKLERELNALKADTRKAGATDAEPAAAPADTATDQRIEKLEAENKQLKTDTRKLEVSSEETAKLKPIAGWDNGFFLQSPDGQNKLNVGGYVHFDGRYFLNSEDTGTSQFLIRRARLVLAGKFLKYYEFKFMPDFAGGQVVIQDAYLNVNYVPWARLQAGKYKTPFGIERLQSANALMFVERSLANNLVPNRDLGFMLWGQPFYGALEYELAIMDGVVDGGSDNTDNDISDAKIFAGRLFFLPFKDREFEPLRGFGFGIAGTAGRENGSVGNPRTPKYVSDGQQTFFSYVTNTPATSSGTVFAFGPQWRISPQAYWYWGQFGFLGEWNQSNNTFKLNKQANNVRANAWQAQVSWVVTGEDNTYRGTTPAKNFDPWRFFDGAWGAVEIAGRYANLSVGKNVYTLGLADRNKSAREASSWAIGVNWYLNKMVRLMLDYDDTTFTGGAKNNGDRPNEEVIMSRVQFVF